MDNSYFRKEAILWIMVVFSWLTLSSSFLQAAGSPTKIPLYGLFEISVFNNTRYDNPFADVELNSRFTSPTGRQVEFFGFFDGDGNGGQNGNIWKQRFMPDEIGTWTYVVTFSDDFPGAEGSFDCVLEGAKPGPWKQDPVNSRWFMTAAGEHFLPIIVFAFMELTEIDWRDAINWARVNGFNTIYSETVNTRLWGDGWPNATPFMTVDTNNKEVDYDRYNLPAWHQYEEMIEAVAIEGLYIAPYRGPDGIYGGRAGKYTVYPPIGLDYSPVNSPQDFDTPRNTRFIRYFVARQAAYWNIAFWSLTGTEVMEVKSKSEVIAYGEYFASITPFGRMITAQDIEQYEGGDFSQPNRTWLAEMNIPDSRKLNTVQGGPVKSDRLQNAKPNNDLALDTTNRGFPVIGTETLWEGQIRALKPLRMIWGSLAAGMHTVWADWSAEDTVNNLYWSLGRTWLPVKPFTQHQYRPGELGADTVGDEQLKIATVALEEMEYWRMNPGNALVSGSTEAYGLAEPGEQYMVYTPRGGTVQLDLSSVSGSFSYKWLNPRTGSYQGYAEFGGGTVQTLVAPTNEDWVLFAFRRNDTDPPLVPAGLLIQ